MLRSRFGRCAQPQSIKKSDWAEQVFRFLSKVYTGARCCCAGLCYVRRSSKGGPRAVKTTQVTAFPARPSFRRASSNAINKVHFCVNLRGNHEIKRNKGFGDVSPTDGTRISGDLDHTIRGRAPSSENEVRTNTCSIRGR